MECLAQVKFRIFMKMLTEIEMSVGHQVVLSIKTVKEVHVASDGYFELLTWLEGGEMASEVGKHNSGHPGDGGIVWALI